MAAPSVVVKSRFAGSATRPTVRAVLLAPPLALPPLPVAVEPAEQPAAARVAVEGEGQRHRRRTRGLRCHWVSIR